VIFMDDLDKAEREARRMRREAQDRYMGDVRQDDVDGDLAPAPASIQRRRLGASDYELPVAPVRNKRGRHR
jgi:hypothetical protein